MSITPVCRSRKRGKGSKGFFSFGTYSGLRVRSEHVPSSIRTYLDWKGSLPYYSGAPATGTLKGF